LNWITSCENWSLTKNTHLCLLFINTLTTNYLIQQKQYIMIQGHGKINLCAAFLKEVIQQCKDVLDDDAITDIIKSCNVIKNEKVQAAKRKVKGQAQKSKKADKAAAKKAMEIHSDVFGDNDQYDEYDEMGGAYEDDFF
jgi:translation initiation factor 3 subunit J